MDLAGEIKDLLYVIKINLQMVAAKVRRIGCQGVLDKEDDQWEMADESLPWAECSLTLDILHPADGIVRPEYQGHSI